MQGVPCWAQYNEILFASDDTTNCGVRNNEIVCPITCSRVLQNVIDDYGCCFELLIDYLDAVFIRDPNDRTIDELTDALFSVCVKSNVIMSAPQLPLLQILQHLLQNVLLQQTQLLAISYQQ